MRTDDAQKEKHYEIILRALPVPFYDFLCTVNAFIIQTIGFCNSAGRSRIHARGFHRNTGIGGGGQFCCFREMPPDIAAADALCAARAVSAASANWNFLVRVRKTMDRIGGQRKVVRIAARYFGVHTKDCLVASGL